MEFRTAYVVPINIFVFFSRYNLDVWNDLFYFRRPRGECARLRIEVVDQHPIQGEVELWIKVNAFYRLKETGTLEGV